MRKFTVLLMLLVAVSFATDAGSVPITDTTVETTDTGYVAPMPAQSVLWENRYHVFDDSARYDGSTIQADDFDLSNRGRIEIIEWWADYRYAPTGGDYLIRFYTNNNGEPGTMLWEVTANPTLTYVDDDPCDVYELSVTLDPADYFIAEAGTTYWLALHSLDEADVAWCVWRYGNMHRSIDNGGTWIIGYAEVMFRLIGTANYSAIEETTWGQIKAL